MTGTQTAACDHPSHSAVMEALPSRGRALPAGYDGNALRPALVTAGRALPPQTRKPQRCRPEARAGGTAFPSGLPRTAWRRQDQATGNNLVDRPRAATDQSLARRPQRLTTVTPATGAAPPAFAIAAPRRNNPMRLYGVPHGGSVEPPVARRRCSACARGTGVFGPGRPSPQPCSASWPRPTRGGGASMAGQPEHAAPQEGHALVPSAMPVRAGTRPGLRRHSLSGTNGQWATHAALPEAHAPVRSIGRVVAEPPHTRRSNLAGIAAGRQPGRGPQQEAHASIRRQHAPHANGCRNGSAPCIVSRIAMTRCRATPRLSSAAWCVMRQRPSRKQRQPVGRRTARPAAALAGPHAPGP